MKRLALALFMLAPFAYANGNLSGFCSQGNIKATVSGLNSTNTLMGSYPRCTVTVTVHGGGAATIYSDNSGTPLDNPFTASTVGWWQFYAANGRYDVTLSGGTPIALPSSWTLFDQPIFDPATYACDPTTTFICQDGNLLNAAITIGPTDDFPLFLKANGALVAQFNDSQTIFQNDRSGGNTILLNNNGGGPGSSTSVNFLKGGVYIGMVGDRGTTGSISLQHASGAEIILSAGVMSIAAPGGGVLMTGGGLTVGAGGADGILAGGFSLPIGPVIDSSGNITAGGTGTFGGTLTATGRTKTAFLTTVNTGSLATAAAGTLNWGSKVIAGVTQPIVVDSLGNQTILGGGGGGSGTVTNVTSNNLTPLFTTSVATPTTTPTISYALSNAAGYSFFSRRSASTGAPSYGQLNSIITQTDNFTVSCDLDFWALIPVSNAGAKTATLPASPCAAGWQVDLENIGAGTWVVDRNGNNIDGGTSNPSITTNGGITIVSSGFGYYTKRGSAASGSGCAAVDPSACILKGSAANSGLNNDAANIAFGLLSAHDVIGAANSVEVLRLRSGGDLTIGLSSSDITPAAGQLIASSVYGLATATTNASTGGFGITAASKVYLNSSHSGSGTNLPISIEPAANVAAVFDINQRSIFGSSGVILSTGGNHKVTVSSSDYGQLGLLQNAGGTSRLTLASKIASVDTAGGELAFDTNNLLFNTAGHAGASLIIGTGSSRTAALTINTSQTATFTGTTSSSFNIDTTAHPLITLKASGSSIGTMGDRGTSGNMSFHQVAGGDMTIDGGGNISFTHGSSTTTLVANNGIVPPSFAFGSLPTGAVGWVICTSCKNVDQDSITAGSQCQSGAHNAMAYFNGTHNVCF
jgi:hypothetical protein